MTLLGIGKQFVHILALDGKVRLAFNDHPHEWSEEVQPDEILDAALILQKQLCDLMYGLDLLKAPLDRRPTLD